MNKGGKESVNRRERVTTGDGNKTPGLKNRVGLVVGHRTSYEVPSRTLSETEPCVETNYLHERQEEYSGKDGHILW